MSIRINKDRSILYNLKKMIKGNYKNIFTISFASLIFVDFDISTILILGFIFNSITRK